MTASKGVVAAKTVHLAERRSPLAAVLGMGQWVTGQRFVLLRSQVARRHADQIACEPKSEVFASTWIAVTVRDADVTCERCREFAPFV